MILIRPRIAGTAASGKALDGIPLPSGSTFAVCFDCFGPAVTQEWFFRGTSQFSGDVANVVVIEYIWDKKPCKGCPAGVSHQVITSVDQANVTKTWASLVNANPHRYAMHVGSLLNSSAPGTTTAVTQ